ncbi:hypothetical protein OIU84_021723 [Salix udensis]|uniref:Uncharacterized protein n=1 Tax=Salix udensis TaxID=889485 RepID=A0AAD6PHW0_9ROSI|nr:hypothetical protein OIU84_021723 [Salix udensis]
MTALSCKVGMSMQLALKGWGQLQAQVLEYFVAGVHLSMRKLLLLHWHFIGFCMNCNNEALSA